MKLYTTVIKINSNDIIKFVKINLINKFLYPLSIFILTALIFTVLGLLPNLLHYTIFYITVLIKAIKLKPKTLCLYYFAFKSITSK